MKIKKNLLLPVIFLCLIFEASYSQGTRPDSAHSILKTAVQKAGKTNKNVLLIFHATWCKWCAILDTMLEDSSIKKIIDDNFIIAGLDVNEHEEKIEAFENPGSREILAKYGGKESGLPFLVFLNKKGIMIANSNVMPEEQNIGYPGADEEISAFIKLLKKTAPRMTKKQRIIISDYLKKNAPQ